MGVLRSPSCLPEMSPQVGPLGRGETGGEIGALDCCGDLLLATESQHHQPFGHRFAKPPLSLVNISDPTMTTLRVKIGVREVAEVLQRFVVTTGPMVGSGQGVLLARRERVQLQRTSHLPNGRVELASGAEKPAVPLVSQGVVRIESNGSLQFVFPSRPGPLEQQRARE